MAMLKGLVIGLGLLIVLALGVIAVTVANRTSGPKTTEAPVATAAPGAFGKVHVELPPGARVVETHIEGGRLVLRIVRPDGSEAVLAYDLAGGRPAGTVELGTAPAAAK